MKILKRKTQKLAPLTVEAAKDIIRNLKAKGWFVLGPPYGPVIHLHHPKGSKKYYPPDSLLTVMLQVRLGRSAEINGFKINEGLCQRANIPLAVARRLNQASNFELMARQKKLDYEVVRLRKWVLELFGREPRRYELVKWPKSLQTAELWQGVRDQRRNDVETERALEALMKTAV